MSIRLTAPTHARRWILPGALILATLGCAFFFRETANASARHLSSGCAAQRAVALTFDDGPDPAFTPLILSALERRNATATFFEEGQEVSAHPEITRSIRDAHMAIGSHSYSHARDLAQRSETDFEGDLMRAEDALQSALGYAPDLYRAPFGRTSENMLRALEEHGYVSIGWDIDSGDWHAAATSEEIATAVLSHAHPGGIVLMHDGALGGGNPDRTATLRALPAIIDGLRQQGYRLVTVPELTGLSAARGQRPERGTGC